MGIADCVEYITVMILYFLFSLLLSVLLLFTALSVRLLSYIDGWLVYGSHIDHWNNKYVARSYCLAFHFFFFLVFSSTCIHLYNFWYSYSGELLMFVSVTLHSMEFWSHRPPVFRFFFLNEYQSTWNFHLFSAPFQSKAEKTKNKNIK